MELTDQVMENILSGCPNLEKLDLSDVCGFHRLEITSAKLKELIMDDICPRDGVEIIAPYIQCLKLLGFCFGMRFGRNVPSLVTAVLYMDFGFAEGDKMEEECSNLRELLQSVAHAKNLKLGSWCSECLLVLELEGWQYPPSSRKFLKLHIVLEQFDFPGIWSFLQSSSDLERLVINWSTDRRMDVLSRYINEEEQARRFETTNFNCLFLHLKTIMIIINKYNEPLSENKSLLLLVKLLLKSATVLEKFVVTARLGWGNVGWGDVSQDYIRMEKEFRSFPRSFPHASFVISYR